ncbi:MAG: hypothetical protein RIB86_05855, partial [Imperialibacter sp.]
MFLLVFIAFSGCKPGEPNVSDTAILISNANVIDVATGQVAKERAILIDSGRITSIGSDSELSVLVREGRRSDAGGR